MSGMTFNYSEVVQKRIGEIRMGLLVQTPVLSTLATYWTNPVTFAVFNVTGLIKVIAAEDNTILGAHIIGAEAGELLRDDGAGRHVVDADEQPRGSPPRSARGVPAADGFEGAGDLRDERRRADADRVIHVVIWSSGCPVIGVNAPILRLADDDPMTE